MSMELGNINGRPTSPYEGFEYARPVGRTMMIGRSIGGIISREGSRVEKLMKINSRKAAEVELNQLDNATEGLDYPIDNNG